MRLKLVATLAIAVAGVAPAAAQVAEFAELPFNILYCSNYEGDRKSCDFLVRKMETDNKKAWRGDYQGQRNVAYCLSDGCGGMLQVNKPLGCAWRVVIIGSGSPKVDNTDISNLLVYCGKLSNAELSAARAQSVAIFRAVYKREIGPINW